MDVQLSKTHELLRKMVREFAENELKPIAKEIDETYRFPRETIDKYFDNGFMGFDLPVEQGGSGGDMLGYVIVMEELSKVCLPSCSSLSGHNHPVISIIQEQGSEYQKKKYLEMLTSGRKLGSFALTEPNAGSDANGIQSTAIWDGENYILNGSKCFITNGGEAEVFIVVAITDPSIPGSRGKSAFIVEKDFEGFSVGKREKLMGFHGGSICELIFNNVKIPKENLIKKEGMGMKIALGGLAAGRVVVAAEGLGCAQGCIDEAVKYVKERKQFRKRISEFQNTQFVLADMQSRVDIARMAIYNVAKMVDAKIPCTKEAAEVKLFATELANEVARKCVQLMGGYGYSQEYPVEQKMRDAKILEIFEGTSEVQKMIISKEMGVK